MSMIAGTAGAAKMSLKEVMGFGARENIRLKTLDIRIPRATLLV